MENFDLFPEELRVTAASRDLVVLETCLPTDPSRARWRGYVMFKPGSFEVTLVSQEDPNLFFSEVKVNQVLTSDYTREEQLVVATDSLVNLWVSLEEE